KVTRDSTRLVYAAVAMVGACVGRRQALNSVRVRAVQKKKTSGNGPRMMIMKEEVAAWSTLMKDWLLAMLFACVRIFRGLRGLMLKRQNITTVSKSSKILVSLCRRRCDLLTPSWAGPEPLSMLWKSA